MTEPMKAAPQANSLSRRDAAVLLHPYTDALANEAEGALVMTDGHGVFVRDETGREYIEGMAGLWCLTLGYGQERLAEAAARQMRRLAFYHGFNRKSHAPQIELAEALLARAPVPMSKVFFANSGSEAVDTAIKLVWYRSNALGMPEKKKIVGRIKGYHGVTVAAGSATGTPVNHRRFDLPLGDRFVHADCPHFAREARPCESEDAFATRMAENLDALIEREGPHTVAAFFAEPVMGAGGVLIPPAGYFDKVQAVLRKHDVLFLVDEVICGFGRTGNMWGSQTFRLEPDMIACAKGLSSGYLPISALMVNERVFRPIAEQSAELGGLGHGFTYGGHPVPAAVALETLKIYDEIDIAGRARAIAKPLRDGAMAFRDNPLTGEIAAIGGLAAIELVDPDTGAPFPPERRVGPHLLDRALEHGLIVRAMGDRIAFSPPLVITEGEIAEMFARFGRALEETAGLVRQGG
jgi:4-aminobutyrate--pyruvate transaminase